MNATWRHGHCAVDICRSVQTLVTMQLAGDMPCTPLPTIMSCSAGRSHTQVACRIRPIRGTCAGIDRGYAQKQSTTGDDCWRISVSYLLPILAR